MHVGDKAGANAKVVALMGQSSCKEAATASCFTRHAAGSLQKWNMRRYCIRATCIPKWHISGRSPMPDDAYVRIVGWQP